MVKIKLMRVDRIGCIVEPVIAGLSILTKPTAARPHNKESDMITCPNCGHAIVAGTCGCVGVDRKYGITTTREQLLRLPEDVGPRNSGTAAKE